MKNSRIVALAVSAVLLAACGGGSSDGNNNPSHGAPLITIGSNNAIIVAANASDAALSSGQLGGMTGVIGISSSSQSGGVTKPQAIDSALLVAKGTLNNGSVSMIPFGPETSECAVSGTITMSGDLADPFTFTAGDQINVDSNNCNDGNGQVVNGLIEMTIASFEGDIFTGLFMIGIDLVVTEFSVTEGGVTETANGDIGTTVDTTNPPTSSGSVFGDGFELEAGGSTELLSDFSTVYTEDSSSFPTAWTNDAMGTFSSSNLAGAVSYDTPVPFAGFGDDYPGSGELLITGADNATLRLVALDNVNVRIDADYDGDGTIDEVIDITWAELAESS